LDIQEKVFGLEHLDVATTYNNIGAIYSDQGEYAKALEYLDKSLAIEEKVLGLEHPEVAITYNCIGLVYSEQGEYAKALEYYGKALDIQEKVLGLEHPDAKETRSDIISTKYGLALSENSLPKFLSSHVFTATVVEGNTPARQQGMSGEYVLLEYADWTQESPTSLSDVIEGWRGKPKDIVVWKDGIISKHHFEDFIGVNISLKQVTSEERQRINEAYEKWKKP
jgi:tetratricopeptide (TPR) repeat protein